MTEQKTRKKQKSNQQAEEIVRENKELWLSKNQN